MQTAKSKVKPKRKDRRSAKEHAIDRMPKPNPKSREKAEQAESKRKFLERYALCGRKYEAAECCGRSITQVGRWQKTDPDFQQAFLEAQEKYVEKLEAESDRRGVDGWEESVFHKLNDELVEHKVRRYSDTLLIFRLKGLAPGKYKDRLESTGPNGGPIQNANFNITVADEETKAELERLLKGEE